MERFENPIGLGTPDINLCYKGIEAWVEIKYLEKFPVKPTTSVKIPHFSNDQRNWLKRRGECSGLAWLFVQTGTEYFLFDWKNAQYIGELVTLDWEHFAKGYWNKRCNWQEWLRIVTKID
jgi:hypothetical protein